jgi:glutathione S-transferase
MARRKADRPTERGGRRVETNAVAAYLTALRAPKVAPRSRANLERRRAQFEQWLSEESSPIREVEPIQRRLDVDAQLARIDQAARLPELEEAFVKVAASWATRTGISAAALREVGVPARVLAKAGLLET